MWCAISPLPRKTPDSGRPGPGWAVSTRASALPTSRAWWGRKRRGKSGSCAASTTRSLADQGLITEKEKNLFAAFQFCSASSVTVYLSMGTALFPFLSVPHLLPLGVILFYKVAGINLMRLYLHLVEKKELRHVP